MAVVARVAIPTAGSVLIWINIFGYSWREYQANINIFIGPNVELDITHIFLVLQAQVIRTKSTETMILPLSVANFVVSSEWAVYGYMTSDVNIVVSTTDTGLISEKVDLLEGSRPLGKRRTLF